MTPTLYSEIFDLAMDDLTNYELDSLFNRSQTDFMLVMTQHLRRAIPNFVNCYKNLTDRDDDSMTFNIELNDLEKDILARYMAIQVLTKDINDIRQIRGMIQNKNDANRYSEANLLDKKVFTKSCLQEDVDKRQTEYEFFYDKWENNIQ